jgi:hypothetical protein
MLGDHPDVRRRRAADLLAAAALLLLPFALLGQALVPGRVLAAADHLLVMYPWKAVVPGVTPANPLLSDVAYLIGPTSLYGAAEVRHGRIPLWNPHAFAGVPFLANPHAAVFFPLTALGYVLPAAIAFGLIAILKLALAGLSLYWCARVFAIGAPAAFLAALSFMLSAVLVVWLQWTFASTIALMPLVLGLTERLRQRGQWRGVSGLAVAVAADLFAGYPLGALYGLAVATVWALVGAGSALGGAVRFLGRFGVAIGLGFSLAAVQLLPFVEYAAESSVVAYREQWMPFLHLPVRGLVAFLMPYFYGSPLAGDFRGDWNFNALAVSVGLVPLIGLPVAVVIAWRMTATRFFVGLALVSGGLLYGAPAAPALAALPIFSWGSSLRVAPVLALALAMLGAIGVEAIATASGVSAARAAKAVKVGFVLLIAIGFGFVAFSAGDLERHAAGVPLWTHYVVFVVALTAAAVLALAWVRSPRSALWWGGGLGLVQLATLLPLALTYNPVMDARGLYPEAPVVRALRAETARDRSRVLFGQQNMGMLHGLHDPTGQDGMTPRRLEEIAGPIGTGQSIGVIGSEPLSAAAVFRSPVLDLLGVRHFVVPPGTPPPPGGAPLEYDGGDARVYLNQRALPRALLVTGVRCVDDATARRLIRERRIDFRREVLLGDRCDAAPPGGPERSDGVSEIVEYGADRIRIDVRTESAAYLLLTDTWFPGWRARVDGGDATVWRADYAFRAVWVPPGRHTVEFRYEPRSFRWGLAVSCLGALATLGIFAGKAWGRRTRPGGGR